MTDRQTIRVVLPCPSCIHQGVCTIEEQIEADLILNIVGVGRPVRLELACSLYADRRLPENVARSEGQRRRWAGTPPADRARHGASMRVAQVKKSGGRLKTKPGQRGR